MARTKLKLKGMTTGTIPGRIKVASENINAMAASKLTGAMPALDGSALTGTSDMVHIKTQSGSNVSSVDFLHGSNGVVFDDTYDIYEFIVHYFYTASGHELRIEPSQDGSGFSNTNTLGYVHGGYENSSGSNHWHNEMGANGFYRSSISAGNAENEQFGGQIRVYSPFDSAKNTVAIAQMGGVQDSSNYFISNAMGSLSAAGRTYGLRFKSESSNVYTKISLYGIKDS